MSAAEADVNFQAPVKSVRRAIPGWPGYFADRLGNIWTKKRGRLRTLAQRVDKRYGYVHVRVAIGRGRRRIKFVHVLVCSAFRGPAPKGAQCRHLDGNKLNNAVRNLRWGTAKANAADRAAHGRTAHGEQSGAAKLDEAAVRGIRYWLERGKEQRWIADLYGISQAVVSQINRKVTWREVS